MYDERPLCCSHFLYRVRYLVTILPIFPNRSLVEVHIELRNVRDALSELKRAVALLGQWRSEHYPEAEAVIALDAIHPATESHLVDNTAFLRSLTDIPEEISAIFLIFPFRIFVGTDILSYLKSATKSHADYYCCLDTLFDDSLATSDVIIYE